MGICLKISIKVKSFIEPKATCHITRQQASIYVPRFNTQSKQSSKQPYKQGPLCQSTSIVYATTSMQEYTSGWCRHGFKSHS